MTLPTHSIKSCDHEVNNMNTKIAIIAVNPESAKLESKLRGFLSKELKDYDMQVIRFHSQDIEDMVKEAKDRADLTIIVFDAEEGMNIRFTTAARELYYNDINPILLITNCDPENENMINSANTSLGEIWLMENPGLDPYELNFHNLFFSYKKMTVDYFPETEESGIKILIKEIKNLLRRDRFH